jgi:hypothetical protein
MKPPARRWRVRNGWETEEEGEAALRLKRRFQGVWHRHDRAARRRRFWRKARRPLLPAAAIAGCLAWVLASSPWPAATTLKHYVAFLNCASAQMVGLTPARAGQPGYWDRLDRDEDGVSCEWWVPSEGGPSAPSRFRAGS